MKRLDLLLAEKNLFSSREKAKSAIISGSVFHNNIKCLKPSELFDEACEFEIRDALKYVSRAGLKLEEAIRQFGITFTDKTVLDVGASTGGFSDCALQNGAKLIYALDVGHGQLDEKIKSNSRVINMENCNFKDVSKNDFKPIDIIVCDVSFISLTKLSHQFAKLLSPGKELITLIKPQFEATAQIMHKCKGVLKDEKIRQSVKNKVVLDITSKDFNLISTADSPILGGDGNKEFLAYFIKL